MKISVTGASGQIGVLLCRTLVEQGHEVKALVRKNIAGLNIEGIKIYYGDVLNPEKLDDFFQDAEIVFHLAAFVSIDGDPNGQVHNINVNGTKNIVDLCLKHKIRRLVHFSSIHAYKAFPREFPMNEENEFSDHTNFPYEQSKANGQKIVLRAVKERGLDAVIVNPTGVLGPYDYTPSVKGKMMIDFYKQKIPTLLPGGFDWSDNRDIVNGAISAMHKGRTGESYILSGNFYSLKDLAAVIGKVTGKRVPQSVTPTSLVLIGVPFVKAWAKISRTEPLYTRESVLTVKDSNPNISSLKAEKELGYSKRPIEETIKDTFDWFIENGLIK